jgi:L-fuconolactonase
MPQPPSESVTDAHLHVWDLAASEYTWLTGVPSLQRTVADAEALEVVSEIGAQRVILVQADDTRSDTAHLQALAARIEARGGALRTADVVAWFPLADPVAVAELLAVPAALERVVGVRHLIHDDPDAGFLERFEVSRSLDLLAHAGLPLDVPDAFPRHLEQAARVARAHPALTLVLDHLGKPPLGDAERLGEWEKQLRAFAAEPNTVAKVSGLATSGDGAFEPAVRVALDAFGPGRLMFGSDWPIAPTPFDVTSGAGRLLAHLQGVLDTDARAQVLSGTAERVYRRVRQRP